MAKELFPQISTSSSLDSLLGITIGFVLGLCFFNYLDYLVTKIEEMISFMYSSKSNIITSSNDIESLRLLPNNLKVTTTNSNKPLQAGTYQSINPPSNNIISTNNVRNDPVPLAQSNGVLLVKRPSECDSTGSDSHATDEDEFDANNPILLLGSYCL